MTPATHDPVARLLRLGYRPEPDGGQSEDLAAFDDFFCPRCRHLGLDATVYRRAGCNGVKATKVVCKRPCGYSAIV